MSGASIKIVPYIPAQGPKSKRAKGRPRQGHGGPNPTGKIQNACISCREKKTRCSGHLPCIKCRLINHPCQYMPIARNRDYQENQPESVITPTCRESFTDLDTPIPSAETGISPIHAHITPEDPPQQDQYGHFHGSSSGFAFLQLAKGRLASLHSMSLDFPDYPLVSQSSLLAALPPKSIADKIVHNYFDFGLTTSRFVNRNHLLASYENLYSDDSDSPLSQDELALIYMVLAIGSHYSQTITTFSGFSASVQYFEMARKQLEKESSKATLNSLQARLLMTHYLLNHSRMHEAWSSFGTISRQAQALRLHRESRSPQMSSPENESRKRLFWSIYIYDRLLSSIFGRPAAIHDDDIDQEECEFADDNEEATFSELEFKARGEFLTGAALVYYARLAKILGRVLREFYGPIRKRYGLSELKEKALEIEELLEQWITGLPAFLNFISLPSSAMSTLTQRQLCTLKLAFAHTTLLLYRPFLLYSMAPTSGSQKASDLEQWFAHCNDKSIDAAYLVVNECRSLYNRGLLSRRFWLVNYVQFAAIGTLYMYTSLRPDDAALRTVADEALVQFPVGVDGDHVGQRYLQILQELQKLTLELTTRINTTPEEFSNDITADNFVFDDALLSDIDPFGSAILDTAFMNAYMTL